MTFLLTGGSANGKSTYARTLAKTLSDKYVIISTEMPRYGAKPAHLDAYELVTRGIGIGNTEVSKDSAVIVECLCNLTANEMFEDGGAGNNTADAVASGILKLAARCRHLIVVTNEVGSDGAVYSEPVMAYIDTLGEINRRLAAKLDNVYELCAGLPTALKGSLTHEINRGGGKMTLIIGGRASGRRDYVKTLGYNDSDIADGVLDSRPVLYNLQKLVAQDPDNAQNMLPELLAKQVVVCDEVGSGIIPIDEAQTKWRVATGALCSALAAQAGSVVRIVCGIPTILK